MRYSDLLTVIMCRHWIEQLMRLLDQCYSGYVWATIFCGYSQVSRTPTLNRFSEGGVLRALTYFYSFPGQFVAVWGFVYAFPQLCDRTALGLLILLTLYFFFVVCRSRDHRLVEPRLRDNNQVVEPTNSDRWNCPCSHILYKLLFALTRIFLWCLRSSSVICLRVM